MCENCSRRDFLSASAMTGLFLAANEARGQAGPHATSAKGKPKKHRIAAIFSGNPVPEDRNWGVAKSEIDAITQRLKQVEADLGDVEFVVGSAGSAEQTAAILNQAGPAAPALVINCSIGGLLRMVDPILDGGRPLAVFSRPASGHDWMYPFRWQQEGKPVTMLTTSDNDELEKAARLLATPLKLAASKLLIFPPLRGTRPACDPKAIKEKLGAEIVIIDDSRFEKLLQSVDEKAALAEAERWLAGAKKNVEPTKEDVLKAARVSLALNQLVAEEDADGLAIATCMRWLAKGFPCLGFTRLRDRGIPASCEGDMDSLLTMMTFEKMLGIAGFQGNSTFDTARNMVWTAHCVGPLKMEGPKSEDAPYLLRSHSEIGGGVVPEIQYRIGQEVTRAKLVNLDTLLVSTGTIREVPALSTRACRTQIVTEVADSAKMVRNWGGGVLEGEMMTLLHRVVFYGDHRQNLRHLADLMKWKVVDEG